MSSTPAEAPYGTWRSPITSEFVAGGAISLQGLAVVNDHVFWRESRPAEGGRIVIVSRRPDGRRQDRLPSPYNARTRVHEYGGACASVIGDTLYFSHFDDQRVYRLTPGQPARPLTPARDLRYADFAHDPGHGRLIAVREDHTGSGEAVNTLVALDLQGDENGGDILVEGHDFYAAPTLSPDGRWLAWLAWNHPNMPWDGTELWLGRLDDYGALVDQQQIAGGLTESVFQPEWSPDGVLHYVSDPEGWWNLFRWENGQSRCLLPMEAEFGQPLWVFGLRTYAFISTTEVACSYCQAGRWYLGRLDTSTGRFTNLETPYTSIFSLRAANQHLYFIGASPTAQPAIIRLDLINGRTSVIYQPNPTAISPDYISVPETITFSSSQGRQAHAYYYPPANPDFVAPEDDRPPLLVFSHGGPTSSARSSLRPGIQFWTSRGYAVADVNYGGSTGYGRAYREQLKGAWGVVDVDDCVHAARYLAEQGLADPTRLAIRGGSAGGYTTLAALAFRDVFQAGASYFGVSDLAALARDTHKFESRYLDSLVGPYPERADLYRARSPLYHLEGLNCPVIFFQGLEDRVVPPDQSEAMFIALRNEEIPTAYVPFAEEQHGFRQAQNIQRSLDGELYFYGRIFGLPPADQLAPVPIENLDDP